MTSDCGGHNHSHSHHPPSRQKYDESSSVTNAKDGDSSEKERDPDVVRREEVLRRLTAASILCASFLVVEVIGGILAGSLAVLSDAAHLFADLASFAVAIAASYLASLPPSDKHTYGLKRSEALAALFSMVSLAIVSIGLAFEAFHRLWPFVRSFYSDAQTAESEPVDGKLMTLIASIGVCVNIALAFILGAENHVHLPGADHGHSHSHEHVDSHVAEERMEIGEGHGHNSDSNDGHDHSHGHQSEGHGHNSGSNHDHDHSHGHQGSHASETDPLCSPDKKELHVSEVVHIDEIPPPSLPHGNDHHNEEQNVNLRAAYLHVLGDLAQSVAVVIAGIVIWAKPSYAVVDPICTLLFAFLVFCSTISVIRSSISVLLEEVPPNVSWIKVHDAISSVAGVSNVHDLHIWSISHGEPALSVHVTAEHPENALVDIHRVCCQNGLNHSTIQVQPSSAPGCLTCGDGTSNQCK